MNQNCINFLNLNSNVIKMIFSYLVDPNDFINLGLVCKKTNKIGNQIIESNPLFLEADRADTLRTCILYLRTPDGSQFFDLGQLKQTIEVEGCCAYEERRNAQAVFLRHFTTNCLSHFKALGLLKESKQPRLMTLFFSEFKIVEEHECPDLACIKARELYGQCVKAKDRVDQAHLLQSAFADQSDVGRWEEKEFTERCNHLDILFKRLFKKAVLEYSTLLNK